MFLPVELESRRAAFRSVGRFRSSLSPNPSRTGRGKTSTLRCRLPVMPVAIRAADEQNATVVAMTADGRVFVGTEPTLRDAFIHTNKSRNATTTAAVIQASVRRARAGDGTGPNGAPQARQFGPSPSANALHLSHCFPMALPDHGSTGQLTCRPSAANTPY